MRSAASSDSIPLHEITGFLSVEKDDHPLVIVLGRTKTRNRDVQSAFHVPCGTPGKGLPTLSVRRSERAAVGVGLKKKVDQYPLGSALVALPDASRLQCARVIIEIPVNIGSGWHIKISHVRPRPIVYQLLRSLYTKREQAMPEWNKLPAIPYSTSFVLNEPSSLTRLFLLSINHLKNWYNFMKEYYIANEMMR